MAEAIQKFEATGRRKTSVARVRMHPGSGQITINGRKVDEYLRRDSLEMIMMQPLQLVESRDKFDITISTR
ncbi:MAG: 30S ribosomal protein S9, partial [Gemmatimonadetes bacterium]|nr:30S ribosomal protein S9 [Gemmatimonadota bacterium]